VGALVADLFVSADGFAGGDGFGPYFGYGGPELDRWIDEHLDEPQQVLLGRRTYELLSGTPGRLTELPKLVVSRTLREPLEWANSRRLDDLDAVRREKAESGTPLRAMGSLSLVAALMDAGLLDRLRLIVFPLVAGPRGREPWAAGLPMRELALERTEVLDGRLLALEYRLA
jgi:dihydrofolate reductase